MLPFHTLNHLNIMFFTRDSPLKPPSLCLPLQVILVLTFRPSSHLAVTQSPSDYLPLPNLLSGSPSCSYFQSYLSFTPDLCLSADPSQHHLSISLKDSFSLFLTFISQRSAPNHRPTPQYSASYADRQYWIIHILDFKGQSENVTT